MTWLEAFLIALVEGLTEFLPVSSTGHMIITQAILGMKSDEFVKLFTINIQFGAILSVVVLYWKRFFKDLTFYFKLLVAFIPAAIAGLLFSDQIDSLLENPTVVAISLLVGGVILVFSDNWFKSPQGEDVKILDSKVEIEEEEEEVDISYPKAFTIGLFQCIAMIPGVSRSAATIIGGMFQGLSRKQAAEFSFFLAVPTMAAATGYKLLKNMDNFPTEKINILIFGNVVAFLVALLAIRFFISFLTKHGFRWFGIYRIILGLTLLALMAAGVDLSIS